MAAWVTRLRWVGVRGLCSATYSLIRLVMAGASSGWIFWSARNPCLRALRATLALPSGVLGPVEFFAFLRLAANLAALGRGVMRLVMRDMARFPYMQIIGIS